MKINDKEFDPKSPEGKKLIKIAIGIIIFISIVSGGVFLIPVAVFGFIIFVAYQASKKNKNVDRNGFDYSKSYSERKSADSNITSSRSLEEEYLKGRNYSSEKPYNKNSYYERKTTSFDKEHAHKNMYPTKKAEVEVKQKTTPLTKEEQLDLYQKELRVLKKQYNDYQIGIAEFREKEKELKTKINELKKDILE
jgi:flagellar biosynthesis component FlhA